MDDRVTVISDGSERTLNQQREEANPKPEGAWFVFNYDVGPYPMYLAKDEIDALRHVERNGYGHVKFWEFGTEWSDV